MTGRESPRTSRHWGRGLFCLGVMLVAWATASLWGGKPWPVLVWAMGVLFGIAMREMLRHD